MYKKGSGGLETLPYVSLSPVGAGERSAFVNVLEKDANPPEIAPRTTSRIDSEFEFCTFHLGQNPKDGVFLSSQATL